MEMPETPEDEILEEVEEEEETLSEVLIREEKEKQRAASKPYVDHLADAVIEENGELKLVLNVGDKLVIERWVTWSDNNRTWLDTKIYEIRQIDHETGNLALWDPEWQHHAGSNFKTGITQYGYKFKVPAKDGKLRKKHKVLKRIEEKEKKEKKEKKPGLRRVYTTRGITHTRLKGHAFGPEGETQALDGDRVSVTKPDQRGNVKVDHPEKGWSETWKALEI